MSMPYVSILKLGAQYHANKNTNYSSRVARGIAFGEFLRTTRVALKMDPSELAHRVGVTENAIRQMELGYTKMASFGVGLKIAHVLGISPWDLAGEVQPADIAMPQGTDRSEPTAATTLELAREVQQLREDVHLLLSDRQGRPAATETPTKRRKPS